MKKLLFYDDLYKFYLKQNKNCNFSSKETGYQLFVQVPATFELDKDKNDELLLFCTVKIMHSGKNRNGSSVTDDALVKASKQLAYKPVLANFMEYTDEQTGEILKDFTSHDFTINEDGSVNYIEKQIGCFTADAPYFEIEEETGHNFLYGRCAIPVNYTDAASIIQRKGGTKVSVELAVNELSYDVNSKTLILSDVDIMGVTCLGKNVETLENVNEGMQNARLDIEDFSSKNNSIFSNINQQMIDFQERLEKIESSCFNDKIEQSIVQEEKATKGGMTTVEENEKFENENVVTDESQVDTVESTDTVEEVTPSTSESDTVTTDTETIVESETEPNQEQENSENVSDESTIFEDKLIRSYEISHDDIRYGLYQLLEAIEESDNTWYWISDVYDTYFIYESYDESKIYKQSYTKDEDAGTVAFTGDRIELFKELLTANEKAELEAMRANYSELKQFKEVTEKNELDAKKTEIINSKKYSVISEKDEEGNYVNEAFAKLVSEMDKYSLSEFETKIKVLHSDYTAEHSNFSTIDDSENKSTSKKYFANPSKKDIKPSRYGKLFQE